MNLQGKKALVTGASGFIGARLCAALAGLGAEVHGVSRSERPASEGRVTWWVSDLQEEEPAIDLLRAIGPDIVFHLSGCVTGSREPAAVRPTFRSNLASTVALLAALQRTGCERVVLAGSMEEPAAGRADASSVSPYAVSKGAASAYGRMYHALYGLPVVILHIFMVYGPGQADPGKLVPYATRSFLRNEAPRLSSGTREVDWIFVDDAVNGLIRGAAAPGVDGETLDIGSGSLVSVREVVETLRRLTGAEIAPEFGARADRPFESSRAADAGRARQRLGWTCRVGLEEGLRRTVAWQRGRMEREEST